MLTELPKLIDFNFAAAFVSPSVAFILSTLTLLDFFGLISIKSFYASQAQSNPILGTTLVVFAAWIIGVLLSAMNRTLIRLLEGYGKFNPLRLFRYSQVKLFRELMITIKSFSDEVKKLKHELQKLQLQQQELKEKFKLIQDQPPELAAKRQEKEVKIAQDLLAKQLKYQQLEFELDKLRLKRSIRFPFNRDFGDHFLLPTELGNIIRAFETYPTVMYGLDGVPGWNRLMFVLSKDQQNIVNTAKAYFDLWLNIFVLCTLFIIEFTALAILLNQRISLLIAFLFFIFLLSIMYTAFSRVKSAAILWGECVKSAFDLYIPVLGQTLGYEIPTDRDGAYRFWQDFSVAIIYKAHKRLQPYKSVAPKSETDTPDQ